MKEYIEKIPKIFLARVFNPSREIRYIRYRQAFIVLFLELGFTQLEIATYLGYADHTTVNYVKKYRSFFVKNDEKYKLIYNLLKGYVCTDHLNNVD